MIPFMADNIYQNIVRSIDSAAPESVHLCSFPVADEKMIDSELENNMEKVLEIVVLGRAARNGAALKNRQPLAKMFVKLDSPLDGLYTDIIKDELNIKEVVFTDNTDGFVSYAFKPQLKTVGPKFGKQLGEIRTALLQLDGSSAKKTVDEKGEITLKLSSGDVTLAAEDLLIETVQKEGFYTLSDRGITVSIDTVLTEELINEGFVREIISKIQTMRKEAGFVVMDHINVTVSGSKVVEKIASELKSEISGDVLADSIETGPVKGYVKNWDINGETVDIGVEKVQ
ncbi:MAG: DUF5915 domain-containing protein [Acutalibacteraceae bacterium]